MVDGRGCEGCDEKIVATSPQWCQIHSQRKILLSLVPWCLMRCLLAAAIVATLILPAIGHAQESQSSKPGDRLILSAGLGRIDCRCGITGGELRAEYSVTPPEHVVGLRVHLGTFWTPTQNYSRPSIQYGEGSTFEGVGQTALVDLGVTGSITPWPRGRVSPYAVAGVAVFQTWRQGSGYYRRSDGSVAEFVPPGSGTRGDIRAIVGAGLRVRAGGRLLQVEARELRGSFSAFSLGTTLHF